MPRADRSRAEELESLLGKPIELIPDSFQHFYNGGKLRAKFLGEPYPTDDFRPEAWIFSTTEASTPGRENPPKEGYSKIQLPSGDKITIDVLLDAYLFETLGERHWRKYGSKLGVLVKIFDVGEDESIPVHWHPTPEFAQKYLSSANGKNEAWIIIGVREKGIAWIGWKDRLSKDELVGLIESDSVDAIKAHMHELEVKVGDVLSIPAGMVHAIGPGVCVLEPQEPTDFSVLAEWSRFPITQEESHLGLGWDLVVDSVDLEAPTQSELKARISPCRTLHYEDGGSSSEGILAKELRPYFWATRFIVYNSLVVQTHSEFHCIVVLRGHGYLQCVKELRAIHKGDSFFIPAGLDHYGITAGTDSELEVVRILPPKS